MALRQHDEWNPATFQGFALHEFGRFALLRRQVSPVRRGEVSEVDAPSAALSDVQIAGVNGKIGHEEGATGLERDRHRIAAGFHVLLHADVVIVTPGSIQETPTVAPWNDPATAVFDCSLNQRNPHRNEMQMLSVLLLLPDLRLVDRKSKGVRPSFFQLTKRTNL